MTTTTMILYEHTDGRMRAAPVGQAYFTDNNPAWRRVGPVDVCGMTMAATFAQTASVNSNTCAEALKDAARYRWLRDHYRYRNGWDSIDDVFRSYVDNATLARAVDAAIDFANALPRKEQP